MQGSFKRLLVWQRAKALAVIVYRMTASTPISRDWGLRDQMRNAAVSIASNIAEGNERGTDKDACRFLFISKGSAGELMTQAEIAMEIGLLPLEEGRAVVKECEDIGRMLNRLIAFRSRAPEASRPSPLVPRRPANG